MTHAVRSGVRVFTVSDEETLHAMRPEWDSLLARSASDGPFLTWEWQAAWWRHLRGRARLSLRLVRRGDGTLVGLAPLAAYPADPRRPICSSAATPSPRSWTRWPMRSGGRGSPSTSGSCGVAPAFPPASPRG
jgi:hypothetical protein